MFRGLNIINLDSKGRVLLPRRYQDIFNQLKNKQLVITIDTQQPCLLLYPLETWLDIEKKLIALPSFDQEARRIQRLLLGHAFEVELDNIGRLLVAPPLREYAQLNKVAALVGQGNKFELWDEKAWKKICQTALPASKNKKEITHVLRELSL